MSEFDTLYFCGICLSSMLFDEQHLCKCKLTVCGGCWVGSTGRCDWCEGESIVKKRLTDETHYETN